MQTHLNLTTTPAPAPLTAGAPTAPGTPTLTNVISPTKRLMAVFTIPGNADDNAGEQPPHASHRQTKKLDQGRRVGRGQVPRAAVGCCS